MDLLFLIPALFLLPIFPFTLVSLKFIDRKPFSKMAPLLFAAYAVGTLLLLFSEMGRGSGWLELWASLSALFYAFRLLSVRNLHRFMLYYYALLSAWAWLWHAAARGMELFLFIHWPIWGALLLLCVALYRRYPVIHRQSINALGSHMPAFSVLFILVLLIPSFTPIFLGIELFVKSPDALSVMIVLIELLAMLLMAWSLIRLFEWLIYGESAKRRRYSQLTLAEALPPAFLLGLSLAVVAFYLVAGGGA